MQIFAFSKYSKCGPAPGPLCLLFPLLTRWIHLWSNVMLEKNLPDKPPKLPQTQPLLLTLRPYSDSHFSVVLFFAQHRFVSLFLYPTHWHRSSAWIGLCFLQCSSPSLWEVHKTPVKERKDRKNREKERNRLLKILFRQIKGHTSSWWFCQLLLSSLENYVYVSAQGYLVSNLACWPSVTRTRLNNCISQRHLCHFVKRLTVIYYCFRD